MQALQQRVGTSLSGRLCLKFKLKLAEHSGETLKRENSIEPANLTPECLKSSGRFENGRSCV